MEENNSTIKLIEEEMMSCRQAFEQNIREREQIRGKYTVLYNLREKLLHGKDTANTRATFEEEDIVEKTEPVKEQKQPESTYQPPVEEVISKEEEQKVEDVVKQVMTKEQKQPEKQQAPKTQVVNLNKPKPEDIPDYLKEEYEKLNNK